MAEPISPTPASRPGLQPALNVVGLSHRYGDRQALQSVSFDVAPGESFGLLGPNGGGKTTFFRIAATLLTPTNGTVRVFGHDVATHPDAVRRCIGMTFQSPALDDRLHVVENLHYHGHLYGLHGKSLNQRIDEVLSLVNLTDRASDLVSTLSGGLQRRVELAKTLLTKPLLLLLDEPSNGLDPGARREVWEHLRHLRQTESTTIIVATHLMDEAAQCDRVGILHEGRLVASGTPEALVSEIGGDMILVTGKDLSSLAQKVTQRFDQHVEIIDGALRLERAQAHEFVPELVEAFPGEIDTITFGKPTLEDVFIHYTGEQLH
ncbi:MAG: ATP-binding cassette domain-containing protein [Acidobacteriota bacterium]|nr:ATP-binding cassette domain-containing protein [Acidobacteriota bacterium]MED5377016.1 ATP-binding cassette domain-containing protein [Acidobacteriota bacterium]